MLHQYSAPAPPPTSCSLVIIIIINILALIIIHSFTYLFLSLNVIALYYNIFSTTALTWPNFYICCVAFTHLVLSVCVLIFVSLLHTTYCSSCIQYMYRGMIIYSVGRAKPCID